MTSTMNLEPSRRRASISDVALQAGVSRAAVSKVIRNAYGVSPAMRARVDAAIEELNYRPRVSARAMRGASFTIGFEIPHLGNDFFTQVMQGATERLHDSEYQLIIAPGVGPHRGNGVIEALIDRQVDGVVVVSSDLTVEQLTRLSGEVPMVVLGRHDPTPPYDTVVGDDATGVRLAMEHLMSLGHTQIAHLTINPDNDWAPQILRREVYCQLMSNAGLTPRVHLTESSENAAHQAALTLLTGDEPPTAILAAHDVLAIGVLRAVADLDRSRDVAVVGYDGIDLADHPLISLTTVDQFGAQMGAAAVELLMEQLAKQRSEPRCIEVIPELRVRKSTAHLAKDKLR